MCGMSQQHPGRSSATRPARPDASMSLLTNVMDHSLDAGYAEAAARREAAGQSGLPRTTQAKLWLAVGLVLAALVVTVAAVQARVDAPTVAKEREELIDRVEEGTREAEALEARIEELRSTVARKQNEALEKHGGDKGLLTALLSGATPTEGPGIKLVIDDAKDTRGSTGGGPRRSSGFSDTGRLRDRDMQRVINGLWVAGAEAVTINDQRLTALSAIRAAGDAILVDNKPLAPPYTVLAVGEGRDLRSGFQESADGRYLRVLRENYGVRYDISVQDKLRLPAASSLALRTAEPVKTGKGSTS
ncbi:DUF881 domain-containing protein [Streptomyces sp. N2-109]|uniref:DUF881 domain-containing protein n=1 Tax=Streptomyces gossypii TaxID=2883101 RepID=A0ABT2K1J2_9ACTN|nr:DUF881 domain-containing protein [Streptomyces gossypii]MCT2594047.1 DUF881 domain-containing protein [Streptomyces gossypii]